MQTNQHIWALTDGRPGNDNQTLAVAEKLSVTPAQAGVSAEVSRLRGNDIEIKKIEFSFLASLPNFLLGNSLLGVKTKIEPPYPDVVISAGRKLSRVARVIKKRSGCKAVQLMWPGYGHENFDLIFTPEHDRRGEHANVIETIGPPSRITPELLAENKTKWQHLIKDTSKPAISLLVGNLSEKEAFKLAYSLEAMEGNVLISTSRRTDPKIVKILSEKITRPKYFHQWSANSENPYLGLLALADYLIVTPDSISMLSEAATTGKPILVAYAKVPHKHSIFIENLYKMGLARKFTNHQLENFTYKPLTTLNTVVSAILEKI